MTSFHCSDFFAAVGFTLAHLDVTKVDELVVALDQLRGRLFVLGVGGSAANASHAVNDFRKLCGIEAYAPTDNVAELTARTNDNGWHTVFVDWLEVNNCNELDTLLILSVGGGTDVTSYNIKLAIEWAKQKRMAIWGIVGSATGAAATFGDIVVVVPTPRLEWMTALSEVFQSVVLHCIVNHPVLRQ